MYCKFEKPCFLLKEIGFYYDLVLNKRLKNFNYLTSNLCTYNNLKLDKKQLTYMYPLLVDDGNKLREYLAENSIYALKLWPNVLWNGASLQEIERTENIILLPIDQRYSDNEMMYIVDIIENYFKTKGKNLKKIL